MRLRGNRYARVTGFTLIEVMLALAIFGMAALAAVQLATGHVNNLSYMEKKSFARYVAANRVAELNALSVWPPRNNISGVERMGERDWYWQQTALETAIGGFRAVTISVSDVEDGDSLHSLTVYVSAP